MILRIILAGLVALIIGVVGFYSLQTIQSDPPAAVVQPEPVPSEPSVQPQEPATRVYSQQAVLPDGSFNPVSQTSADPASPPQALIDSTWRDRYQEPLTAVAADGPAIGFFPFLDLTEAGLSQWASYGWHLTGNAALARWTNARVAGSGIALSDPLGINASRFIDGSLPDSINEWSALARRHRSFQPADHIITGIYRTLDDGRVSLSVYRIEPGQTNPDADTPLFQITMPYPEDFMVFAQHQREALNAIIDALVAQNVISRRTALPAADLDLNDELKSIALQYDCNDSWGIMDAIDRSLALSALFPDQPQPLQAAAYGYNLLNELYFDYPSLAVYSRVSQMSSLALAQLLMAESPEISIHRLLWALPVYTIGYMGDDELKQAAMSHPQDLADELAPLQHLIILSINFFLTPEQIQVWPEPAIFDLDKDNLWYYGASHFEDHYRQRRDLWPQADAFQWLVIKNALESDRLYLGSRLFNNVRLISEQLSGAFAARQAAAFLCLGADSSDLPALSSELAGALDLKPQAVADLADQQDYFKIRSSLWDALKHKRFDAPYHVRPEYPATLEVLTPRIRKILDRQIEAPQSTLSGFAGFEFTPARRLQFFQRTEHAFLLPLIELNGSYFGHYESLVGCVADYLAVRPDNPSLLDHYADELDHFFGEGNAIEQRIDAMEASFSAWPLPYTASTIAFMRMYKEKPQEAKRYADFYNRQDAFNTYRFKQLGDLYNRYGYRARAVENYTQYLEHNPDRYDVANLRLILLCELGHQEEMDQTIRAEMKKAITELPGNGSFHREYLNYLFNIAEDYEKTIEAAEYYIACKPKAIGTGKHWQALSLKAMGQQDKAIELMNGFGAPAGLAGLGLASFYCTKADAYFELGRIDLAEQMIDRAKQIDSWRGDVITSMARLAFEKGDYQAALLEYERYLDRYGPNRYVYRGMVKCYREMGQTERAIDLLERAVFDSSLHDIMNRLTPTLMDLYAETNQTGRSRELLDRLLQSGARNRLMLTRTLDAYESINPAEAKQLRGQLPRIIAEPHSLDSLLDQPAS